VANAVEAAGQHVDEEAADELVRRQRHGRIVMSSIMRRRNGLITSSVMGMLLS
jgi:hypothetical protein